MVDNGVGVGGVMGTVVVAKSTPDAYTLVQCNVGTAAIALSLYATCLMTRCGTLLP